MKLLHAVSVVSWVAFTGATPTPSIACPSTPSLSTVVNTNVFGIPGTSKSIPATPGSTLATAANLGPNPLHVRGGELHEPETVEDVDALLLNAASNNQLVVIDFTASW